MDVADGRELASQVFPYPSGTEGVIVDSSDPNLARQNPADYLLGIETTVSGAMRKAKEVEPRFRAEDVIGIGVDTTGSSPMPLDERGQPLCSGPRFNGNPAAYVWLW